MGQKRVISKSDGLGPADESKSVLLKLSKKARNKKIAKGIINISVSFNNTLVNVADSKGEVLLWSSAGSLGFKGSRKSTPYAATIVAKDVAEKAKALGMVEAEITVKGIGSGREAAIRGVAGTGINITSVVDTTPMPHNGVKPPKPRRV
ncbi:MAG: 30S ribosomal protein S11 [Candidatus Yanofskybacteria bacterium CG10_big_fil_rev_8_21_14_0_10_36_16]|uniref:Small ribosomal subunit protein uS11 n=1 Tax=Candidatus Yanofskybacteria bacterium CG10_big_fil_rev_8_21_14_0_10_36_16 TaxID=1975096 RepID=A0A2J0Q7L9_9BACT|nr:MAG: 30S ribosomal protein S11 [Candidatus Yanofskybacteria bacterium CG10_big_fil_rev_8_21_14_0_10_36_16]